MPTSANDRERAELLRHAPAIVARARARGLITDPEEAPVTRRTRPPKAGDRRLPANAVAGIITKTVGAARVPLTAREIVGRAAEAYRALGGGRDPNVMRSTITALAHAGKLVRGPDVRDHRGILIPTYRLSTMPDATRGAGCGGLTARQPVAP